MRQGWLPVPNPVAFSIGNFDIMWYGIMLSLGIITAFAMLFLRCRKEKINSDRVYDLIIWGIPFGIIGARLYYVIFEWGYYKDNLAQIFNLRGGGLAVHGAIIGGFGIAIIMLHHWKEDIAKWIDMSFACVPIAQAIGRWGNYFNSEAHGVATDLPWAIYADGEWVHPTFLYESLWCLLLFIFLTWFVYTGKQKFPWQVTCLYCMLYSVERFLVESLRTDSLMIGPFRQAQMLSFCTIIIAAVAYIILYKKSKKPIPAAEETSTVEEVETEE
ncbi:MAG: prolipoprotein diacylglyceryl transferase [Clostridia bacterium]|nr:prolipoprotein diacylglyceryl transferase [Clostridia bacterium]